MKRILAKILCGVFFFACMLGLVACGMAIGVAMLGVAVAAVLKKKED